MFLVHSKLWCVVVFKLEDNSLNIHGRFILRVVCSRKDVEDVILVLTNVGCHYYGII